MDLNTVIEQAADAIGLPVNKPKRKYTKKAKVGRPRKSAKLEAQPKKLPKTKLLSLRFVGDTAELTFRDLRKVKTPLKYLDKRLTRLEKLHLRTAKISKNGQTIIWADYDILVQVAHALHFEA